MTKKILILVAIFVLFWAGFLTYRFYSFGYYDWDLAIFSQAMWNLSHGSAFVTLLSEGNFFGNHANFIAFFLIPFYWVFPHPLLLVCCKIISLAVAGWFIYKYAERELGAHNSFLLTILYFFYPANIFGLLYEFDMEALAVGVVAGMFYAYVRGYWRPFLWCGLALILIKENLPLILFAFGIHAFFTKKDKLQWAGIPVVLGAGAFSLLALIVVPFFTGRGIATVHPYAYQYARFGSSIPEILITFITHPWELIHFLNTPLNQAWFMKSIGVLFFVPLLGLPILFLVSPIIFMNLLSDAPMRHTIYYSYMLVIAPFIFFALTRGLVLLPRFRTAVIWVVISMIGWTLYTDRQLFLQRAAPYPAAMIADREKIMSLVPAQAPVVASFPFLAKMANRRELYALYKLYSPLHVTYHLPAHVQYALVDDADIWYQSSDKDDDRILKERLAHFFADGWTLQARAGHTALYTRGLLLAPGKEML